jgi:hypothetical protein
MGRPRVITSGFGSWPLSHNPSNGSVADGLSATTSVPPRTTVSGQFDGPGRPVTRVYCAFPPIWVYNPAMASPASVTNIEADVTQVLADYYRAFSTLEVQAVLPYFHEPSLLIGPKEGFVAKFGSRVARVKNPWRSRRQIRSRDVNTQAR